MTTGPLRVLVVDDTVTYRKIVKDVLGNVAGTDVGPQFVPQHHCRSTFYQPHKTMPAKVC